MNNYWDCPNCGHTNFTLSEAIAWDNYCGDCGAQYKLSLWTVIKVEKQIRPPQDEEE